jgi:hypothetical protein
MLSKITTSVTVTLLVLFLIGTFQLLVLNQSPANWYFLCGLLLLPAVPLWFAVLLRAFIRSCLKADH